ncbi:expressed unknown protein [Ectocarpus siliculosus]|uniref:ELM2 domain-containing protein n=1 Tax=Ectocarpus siliculosus TaxID=2880 RepID=D8LCW0_ECTSI|nr:expressed unknown protein [Ectocarpus siliculosus]|eukprot:CBN75502.1 expressed unknown protein [Ectocarpus siliculosus]
MHLLGRYYSSHIIPIEVLSMWEDTFTGLFKFRARYLVYASDLPEDAIARLGKDRLAFEDKGTTGSNSGVKVASASNPSSPLSKRDQKADDDEVFLTNKREDLDAVLIDKPVTLCVGIRDDSPAGWKRNLGPRLTHSFDVSSGEFTPVECTDAIAKRARIRLVEAVARASRRAEEVAAADSGQRAMQSSGWLLPKRRTVGPAAVKGSADRRGSIAAATSVGDTVSVREPSEGESSEGEEPKSDDPEWENDDQDSDYASDISNSTDRGNHDAQELRAGGSVQARAGSTGATPSSPTSSVPRCSAETTRDAGGALGSKCRPSIAGTRTRGRSTKAAVDGAEKSDCDPQQILVGDDYQADIPDLLSAEERKEEAGHPAAGTGAKMVWRSIRNWDPQSRQMLSTYLHAAKDVLQKKQASPGVAVHVRLGDSGSAAKGDKGVTTSVASSYAVWAITAGRHSPGVTRVACSEMAQTNVPMSAVQRVQSEEEALAALVKARCTLDDFRPALKVLDQASTESVAPWTLSQVRTLEQVLEKEFKWDRRLHGWAREGMDLEREDFIDLANVCKQVRGKTRAQVLSFYYRYLAHAKPLTDVVYGKEAAEARKLEAILPAGTTKSPKETSTAQLKPATSHTAAGPPTNGPAIRNRSIATQDPQRKPKLIIQAAPGPPVSTTQNRGVMPDDHKRPLATVATAGLGVRVSASAPHYAPPNGNVSREYQRRAVRRGPGTASGNGFADVEVLEVKNPHNTARGVCFTPGSQYTSVSGFEAGRERQVGTKAQSRQISALASVGMTAPAPYGYRNVMAVARQGERLPQSHVPVHVNAKPKEAAADEDGEFGFMYPCWRLLERANAYMDQDQLVYMRGLLVTHIHKPMTRAQLLERAESCLQEQPEIFMAFVKVFDRINHPYTDPHPVPLYSGTKRPTPDTPAEPRSVLRTSFSGRVPPTDDHVDSRARASYSSYARQHAVVPTFAASPGAAVDGVGDRHGNGQGRGGGGGGVRSGKAHDPYPCVAADGAADARRRWAVPAALGSGIGGWRHGASGRPSTYVSGDAELPPPSYSAGPTGGPVTMYDGRDGGFDVSGELMRAWPQKNQQHPPSRWPTGGSASSYAIPGGTTEARKSRPRMPGWVENGR